MQRHRGETCIEAGPHVIPHIRDIRYARGLVVRLLVSANIRLRPTSGTSRSHEGVCAPHGSSARLAGLTIALVALIAPLAVTSTAQAAVGDGLVAWYPLDETTGTVAKDARGNGRNGTVEGATTWLDGNGFRFGGGSASSGNAIKLPDNLTAGLASITVRSTSGSTRRSRATTSSTTSATSRSAARSPARATSSRPRRRTAPRSATRRGRTSRSRARARTSRRPRGSTSPTRRPAPSARFRERRAGRAEDQRRLHPGADRQRRHHPQLPRPLGVRGRQLVHGRRARLPHLQPGARRHRGRSSCDHRRTRHWWRRMPRGSSPRSATCRPSPRTSPSPPAARPAPASRGASSNTAIIAHNGTVTRPTQTPSSTSPRPSRSTASARPASSR